MAEFKAFLVKMNGTPALNFGLTGVIVFGVAVILLLLGFVPTVAIVLSICGIVMVLLGTLSNDGKGLVEVDKAILVLNANGIHIGSMFYPYAAIHNLTFRFDGFNGQSPFGYFTETSGRIQYGLYNSISFTTGDLPVSEMFYLADQTHADSFFLMITLLRQQGISIEINSRQS